MIHRITPGKAAVTQKSEFCMTKLRVLVIALRSLFRKRIINMSLVTLFLFPSRAGHFLPKIQFRDVLNRYF